MLARRHCGGFYHLYEGTVDIDAHSAVSISARTVELIAPEEMCESRYTRQCATAAGSAACGAVSTMGGAQACNYTPAAGDEPEACVPKDAEVCGGAEIGGDPFEPHQCEAASSNTIDGSAGDCIYVQGGGDIDVSAAGSVLLNASAVGIDGNSIAVTSTAGDVAIQSHGSMIFESVNSSISLDATDGVSIESGGEFLMSSEAVSLVQRRR